MYRKDADFQKALLAELNGSGNVPFGIVESALETLDRQSKALVRMRYLMGLSDRQISLILSLPEDGVRTCIEDSVERIKDIVDADTE